MLIYFYETQCFFDVFEIMRVYVSLILILFIYLFSIPGTSGFLILFSIYLELVGWFLSLIFIYPEVMVIR